MSDGPNRHPKMLPAPHADTVRSSFVDPRDMGIDPNTRVVRSTFVDPRDVGIDPQTGLSMSTNPARRSAQQSRRPARSGPSAGAGPPTGTGSTTETDLSARASPSGGARSTTETDLSAGASPSAAAGPSGAARPQPALPDISTRLPRRKAPTRAGPSGGAQPQPAIPSIVPTRLPLPGRRKRRPEGPPTVERRHIAPHPGLDKPIERSPSVEARGQRRAPASGSAIPPQPAYTIGRPADPSSEWESMLVEQAKEQERILEKTVVEFIRLEKGQPSLDPEYEGMDWGDTFKAASETLEGAMRRIDWCERQLRLLGISTRVPGPDRFRLHRIPSRLHLPARGDRVPPLSAGGDMGAAGGAAGSAGGEAAAGGIVGGAGAGAGAGAGGAWGAWGAAGAGQYPRGATPR
ncbi:hypothetical protein GJ744_002423 [Endocarpon pusillum]|uniref:Uncharacterized protein n=1 Tax=Endocarpon pusillum TaxID=364733 RepID=A0A8H7AC16_9EURO|nr:hypothetical protein GJ744_002423 [Endocarpon pusillum]